MLEPAILAGTVPSVVLVGVHNAVDPARVWPDRRAQEYLPGISRRRFDAHLRFVTDEVVPWAAGRFGVREGPWVAAGTLEAGFRQATLRWAGRLQRAGIPCRHQESVGGHDPYWWQQQLPGALAWLLAPL